jgi:hypothetical protein
VKVPLLDKSADRYFKNSITKAGIAYATCRVINATMSLIKESNVQLQPAGMGITLAIGQIVDPVDDATERLSDVMATVIVSLGVEKLLYDISVSLVPRLLSILLLVLLFLLWFKKEKFNKISKILLKVIVIILFARLCLPLSALVNNFVHKNFFEKRIEMAKHQLSLGSAELDKLQEITIPPNSGFLGTLRYSAMFLKQKTVQFKDALVYTVKNVGMIIENLLSLMLLYVGVFIIQVIMLPLLIFWLLVKMSNSFFSTEIPFLLTPRKAEKKENNGTII